MVHAAFAVGENAVAQDALGQPRNISLTVVAVDRNQHHESPANSANDLAVYTDVSLGYSLQQSYHFELTSLFSTRFGSLLIDHAE
jgi:hypothetical protein